LLEVLVFCEVVRGGLGDVVGDDVVDEVSYLFVEVFVVQYLMVFGVDDFVLVVEDVVVF